MRDTLAAVGGRRFVLAVMSGLMATALQWFGKLDPAGTSYAIVIGATVAAYLTSNTVQKVKGNPE